ncbi:MAG: hypothetical protein HZB59_07115 [Ignavibacteriales bacterium]|nr:hypothetical protein [Ignavibacteriales bacterium]
MKKFMFLLVVCLFVSGIALAQPANQNIYTFNVTSVATGLTVEAGDVTVEGLMPGVCYEVVPDPAGLIASGGITPVTSAELAAITAAVIAGDPFSEVIVSCAVPTILLGDGTTGNLALTYTGTSAEFLNGLGDGWFFNPTAGPFVGTLDDGGAAEVWIGFNTCVPKTIVAGGTWLGEGLLTVQYK